MKLNEKILFLRKRAGLSQEELANKLDVSRQAIYKWETENSMPEISKIKDLAKLFNVTFNYLMNDDIETIEEEKPKVKVISRSAFLTDEELPYEQADLDHGYARNRKSFLKSADVDNYFQIRRREAEKAMKAVGATEIYFIQTYSTTAFFYDADRKVCGIYFSGGIQFVCPIENLVGFEYNCARNATYNTSQITPMVGFGKGGISGVGLASMPTTNTVQGTTARAVILYTSGKQVKQYALDLGIASMFYLNLKIDIDFIPVLRASLMDALQIGLKELQVRIYALIREAKKVTEGEVQTKPMDYNLYVTRNKETKAEYQEYLDAIEYAAILDKKKETKSLIRFFGRLIGIGVLLLAIGIFALWISGI